MRLPSKETLALLRSRYPKGARVELVRMDDPQAPPVGTKGTVLGVDDVGSILVARQRPERGLWRRYLPQDWGIRRSKIHSFLTTRSCGLWLK